ncbi:MAG: 2-oxo acid dehydrogenase subunit E2 [Mycobacterium leprae]
MNQLLSGILPGLAPGLLAGGPASEVPAGAPGGMVLPGGTKENPLAIGVLPGPPFITTPLSHIRQVSIMNLEASRQSVVPVSIVAEVDASNLVAARAALKPQFERSFGIPLTYTPFFVRATTRALQAYPIMNSMLTPQGHIIPRQINIGVATQAPGGVLLPTIQNAESKGIGQVALELYRISQLAPTGQLGAWEMANQTFIITNTGRFGVTLFGTPVIKPPNVGILAFEAIKKQPVVLDDDRIVVRPMMYVVLTADHRAVDGVEMMGFIGKVKESLEKLRL